MHRSAVPDPTRADACLVLIGEWQVPDAGTGRRAADAALAAWRQHGWPDGLRAHHCLLGEDGRTVLHYAQWADEEAARTFAGTGKPAWARSVDRAVPGVRHTRVTAYRRYRDTDRLSAPPSTGCLVTVTVTFDGADQDQQRAWVDNVFAAAGTTESSPSAGMLAAHFHVSLDGTRVLNLAEWTTADAHRAAVTGPDNGFRTRVRGFPGVGSSAARRYLPHAGLSTVP